MEAYDVGVNIENCCAELEDILKEVENFAKGKKLSTAKMLYRKAIEKAVRTLEADNQKVTTIKLKAEGMCADDEGKVIDAEIEWKALLARLEGRKAILNGWQSYNRHLDTVAH